MNAIIKERIYVWMIIILCIGSILKYISDHSKEYEKKIIQLEEKKAFLCKENDSLRLEIDSRDHILIENHLWDYYK